MLFELLAHLRGLKSKKTFKNSSSAKREMRGKEEMGDSARNAVRSNKSNLPGALTRTRKIIAIIMLKRAPERNKLLHVGK